MPRDMGFYYWGLSSVESRGHLILNELSNLQQYNYVFCLTSCSIGNTQHLHPRVANTQKSLIANALILIALLSTILSVPLVGHYYPSAYQISAQSTTNPLGNMLSHFFGNITNTFNQLAKKPEYTVNVAGNQIFPNNTLKENIVDKYQATTYNIKDLKYNLLGFNVAAHDIKIHVNPSKIDANKTRIDIPLMLASNVTVTNGIINLNYGQVDLGSIYGIYDKPTDKMIVHIPFAIASKYLRI